MKTSPTGHLAQPSPNSRLLSVVRAVTVDKHIGELEVMTPFVTDAPASAMLSRRRSPPRVVPRPGSRDKQDAYACRMRRLAINIAPADPGGGTAADNRSGTIRQAHRSG
ncbi:MAG: hypothetical protein ACLR9W_02680 [Enterobacter hormaechei]